MDAGKIAVALDSRTDKTYMDADYVRPAQVKSYLKLMPQVAEILGGVEITNAHGVGAGLAPPVRKQLTEIMVGLPKSHIWVKGLVAVYTYLQVQAPVTTQ